MTRPPLELLRDVATALTCYASTRYVQAYVQKIPSIRAAMLEEVAHIEALEREVREALRAQAEVGAAWVEITPSVLGDLSDGQRVWAATRTGLVEDVEYQWCAGHYPHQFDGEDATDGYYTHLMRQHEPQHPALLAQADAAAGGAEAGGAR